MDPHNTMLTMMVDWGRVLDFGPNSIPASLPYSPSGQAFTHGAYMTIEGEAVQDGEDQFTVLETLGLTLPPETYLGSPSEMSGLRSHETPTP